MMSLIRQSSLIILLFFLVISLKGQDSIWTEQLKRDSLQDTRMLDLERKIRGLNAYILGNAAEQKRRTDSLQRMALEQENQILALANASDSLDKLLQIARQKIHGNTQQLKAEKRKFKKTLFILVPVLLLISLALAALLLILINKHRSLTDQQLSALRRYTYEELEEVKEGYRAEIKRRVKKVVSKILPTGKKKKNEKKKKKKT